jgi:hypothetical protein
MPLPVGAEEVIGLFSSVRTLMTDDEIEAFDEATDPRCR